MTRLRLFSVLLCLGLGALLVSATVAQAGTLTLSDESSGENKGDPGFVPASVLDATLDFNITGATELTITVNNLTSGDELFDINELAFNGSSNVTSLSLDSVDGTACLIGDGSDCGWTFEAKTFSLFHSHQHAAQCIGSYVGSVSATRSHCRQKT